MVDREGIQGGRRKAAEWSEGSRFHDPLPGRPYACDGAALQPRGREFRGHHEFVATYVSLLGALAATLDPPVTARRRTPRTPPVASSVNHVMSCR